MIFIKISNTTFSRSKTFLAALPHLHQAALLVQNLFSFVINHHCLLVFFLNPIFKKRTNLWASYLYMFEIGIEESEFLQIQLQMVLRYEGNG